MVVRPPFGHLFLVRRTRGLLERGLRVMMPRAVVLETVQRDGQSAGRAHSQACQACDGDLLASFEIHWAHSPAVPGICQRPGPTDGSFQAGRLSRYELDGDEAVLPPDEENAVGENGGVPGR